MTDGRSQVDHGPGRIDALTGLRFVAAVAVFLSHLPPAPIAPGPLQTFIHSGYDGVTLFFILSGFVLAWNYGDRLGAAMSGRTLWSFAVARVARIYPLYLFALGWAIAPLVVQGEPVRFLWHHVLAIQAWSGDLRNAQGHNGPGWSIGVEFFLYACFPLLLLAMRPIRRNPWALGAVVVVCLLAGAALVAWAHLTGRADLPWRHPDGDHRWLYRNPVPRLGDFVLGMAAAFLCAGAPERRSAWWGRSAQVVGGGTVVLLMCSSTVFLSTASLDAAYMAPMFLLILGLALTPSTWLGRLLSARAAVLLGEASFALYLLHSTLLIRLEMPWRETFASWLIAHAVLFAIILCAAIGAHLAIEKPAQRWLRRVLDRPAGAASPGLTVPSHRQPPSPARVEVHPPSPSRHRRVQVSNRTP